MWLSIRGQEDACELWNVDKQLASAKKEIRANAKATYNRLRSIIYDAEFVRQVGTVFQLPIVGTEDIYPYW